ncbi:MFS transporter [Basilea psittacipulmonis]|uniref:MFS transporter n=1 Tax=Basilea psittacipulmonis TaxID=1472345 RepID=UPI00068D6287|nr:MFS transporter [Basilea psittacipulmonis]
MYISSTPNVTVKYPGLVIFSLALGAFSLGITEFSVMTLIVQIAQSWQIPTTTATHLISAYAIGVVIGAPLLSLYLTNLPRRKALLTCMGFFVLTHIACILSPNYELLLVFRFLSGLPHGAYLGVASLVAAGIMGPENRGKAVARVLLGLTIATIIGAPLLNYVGNFINWRIFMMVAILTATLCIMGLIFSIPTHYRQEHADLKQELKALGNTQIWLALACGAVGFGGMFAVYSYMADVLQHYTHISHEVEPWIYCVFGIGFSLGYMIMGHFIDKSVTWSGIGIILWAILWLVTYPFIVHQIYLVFIWSIAIGISGGIGAVLQVRLMDVAGNAQTMAAALNHSAFNTANAIGPLLGGYAITHLGGGSFYPIVGYVGAGLAVLGLLLWIIGTMTYHPHTHQVPQSRVIKH